MRKDNPDRTVDAADATRRRGSPLDPAGDGGNADQRGQCSPGLAGMTQKRAWYWLHRGATTSWGISLIGLLMAGTAAAAVTYATTSTSTAVYYACLKLGNLSNVGTSPVTCQKGATPISWNEQGVPGTAGADGQSVTSAALAAGDDPHCPNGGSSFTSASGVTYACNGVDGKNGVGLTSLDDLNGLSCHNGAGLTSVAYSGATVAIQCLSPEQLTVDTNGGDGTGTVSSSPAGINCPSTCSAAFVQNSGVTLTARPDLHMSFTGWSGACSGTDSTCTVTMDAAKAVTATFVRQYPLTITTGGTGSGATTTDPAGISCPGTCTAYYPENTVVTVQANAALGSAVTAFSSGCTVNTVNGCAVTMTAAMTVNVTYTSGEILTIASIDPSSNGPGIHVTSDPAGIDCWGPGENGPTTASSGYGYCQAAYTSGETATLTAAGPTGLVWTGDCSGSTSTPCSLDMTSDKSVGVAFG